MKNLLICGGAGFIGSNFVRYMLDKYPDIQIVVYDKLTYAGNPDNLEPFSQDSRYKFLQGDIAEHGSVARALEFNRIDTIVNFAAETHVDRSILDPDAFVHTNVMGVYVLLEESRKHGIERFLQVSTDEVYGSIPEGAFEEGDPIEPNSPYAASKASGDLMARAYHVTYGMHTIVTRGSNTFGPYQYPEKVLPLFITNALEDQPLPLYGDGKQVRDWLYVDDHCAGIDAVLQNGRPGEAYNIGGENEQHNIDVVHMLLRLLDKPASLIRPVEDRPGHDRRYALDNSKSRRLGWKPEVGFDEALERTVSWYKSNEWWWRKIKSGEYQQYYEAQYGKRLKG
ncbi:MAG: dTDP-glucose 4,6-dehydratase [Anaerolineae bacterium]|nr:dTDP-glucose 4,6-dehydratase [Anaerolineae bacterium]